MYDKNPFTLTFGKQPNNFISRYDDTTTVIDTFCNSDLSQTYLIEGVRGSGKTVLMTAISNELKEKPDWIAINLNPSLDLLEDMARRLHDSCKTIPNLLGKNINISFAGIGVGVGINETLQDSISIIRNILEPIKKKNKKVLITIDEVLNNKNMRTFASQFQIFVREDYPIYLIMTGLSENINEIQNDPALTFLLRSPKIFMGPLSSLQITKKYSELLNIDTEKAKELASVTQGYAFAYQALGASYWEYKKNPDLQKIISKLDDMLDDYVYKKIWASLTDKEKEIVLSIDHPHTPTAEICQKTGIKPTSFSQYKKRLTLKGVLSTENHGYNTLALPRFYEIVIMY